MLELIFQGLIEWLYGLLLEAWEYFFSVFMDVLSVDFEYLKTNIPVIPEIMKVLMAVGWALLLGNLVFQATKSMVTGLGFEGEDPKTLFLRTFVFAFLLAASPQICEIGLNITARIIELLDMTSAAEVELVTEDTFGAMGASWLLVIIVNVILMFKVLRMLLEIVEQYLVLAFLTICAPMAFGMGGSKNTADIFTGWCRMFGSMCFVIMSNMLFFKLLLSLLSTVPEGMGILLWIAMVFGVVKVARKVDAIITRIGLNPAITGDGLGGRSLPGMLVYTVIRSMAGRVVKAAGRSAGSSGNGGASGAGTGGKPTFRGPSGGSGAAASNHTANHSTSHSASSSQSGSNSTSQQQNKSQNTAQNTAQTGATQSAARHPTAQNTAHGTPGQGDGSWTPAGQGVSVFPDDSDAAALEGNAAQFNSPAQAQPAAANANGGERKSSVPPGTVHAPSHVKQGGAVGSGRNPGGGKPTAVPSGAGKPGAAGTKGTSGVPARSHDGKAPQPGMAGIGNTAEKSDRISSRPGAPGMATAAETRQPFGQGAPTVSGPAGTETVRDVHSGNERGTTPASGRAGTQNIPGGKSVVPQPGLADTGAVRADMENSARGGTTATDTRKTAFNAAASPGITPSVPRMGIRGAAPQAATADKASVPRPNAENAGQRNPGAAGTASGSDLWKSSVSAPKVRPGMAGASGGTPGTSGKVPTPGSAGNGVTVMPGQPSGGQGGAHSGMAGTAGKIAERAAHIGSPPPQGSAQASGGARETRFSNAQHVAQNQTVQNSVQSGQQSAVTLEGAKQTPPTGAGRVPPAAVPGANAPVGGTDSRFTQRPAPVHMPPSRERSPSGAAGTPTETRNASAVRENAHPETRGTGITAPAAAGGPGTAKQETRAPRQTVPESVPSARKEPDAARPKTPDNGNRGTPGAVPVQQKPRSARSAGAGESTQKPFPAAGTARQEHRPSPRSQTDPGAVPSARHPGMAGIAPPAARVSPAKPTESRPSRPEETISETVPEPEISEKVPEENEVKGDGE